jgi:ribosomal protein L29
MAILKNKDIRKMSDQEIEDKTKELKLELIKNKVSDKGKLRVREIKRTIARLLTFSRIKSIEDKEK